MEGRGWQRRMRTIVSFMSHCKDGRSYFEWGGEIPEGPECSDLS